MRQTNNPNAGFTLIEVVLSIGILAIISIPLLNYFTESMRYSAMMASRQQATYLAQEITEGLLADNRLVTYNLEPEEGAEGNPSLVYTVGYLQDKDGEPETGENGELVYHWTADDVYEVFVTIEELDTLGGVKLDDVRSFSDYSIDPDTDVVYVDTTENAQAVFELMGIHYTNLAKNGKNADPDDAVTGDDIRDSMSRVMYVDLRVEDDGSYRVRIQYEYTCEKIEGLEITDPEATDPETKDDSRTWKSSVLMEKTVKDLQNIYLIYNWCEGGDTVIVRAEDNATWTLVSGGNGPRLNIIYQQRVADDGTETVIDPSAGYYRLDVLVQKESDSPEKIDTLYGHTNLDSVNGLSTPSDAGTTGNAESVQAFSIHTKIYPKGHDNDGDDLLAEIITTKGE